MPGFPPCDGMCSDTSNTLNSTKYQEINFVVSLKSPNFHQEAILCSMCCSWSIRWDVEHTMIPSNILKNRLRDIPKTIRAYCLCHMFIYIDTWAKYDQNYLQVNIIERVYYRIIYNFLGRARAPISLMRIHPPRIYLYYLTWTSYLLIVTPSCR